jgi:DNA polymerase III subunit gamma/tau
MNDLPLTEEGAADEPALDLAPLPRTRAEPGYRVLARKYRPQRFEDLIGQAAMVRTLTNAFASGRIAHAFMLTGVRGVGKTTTARIIARALNYVGPNGEQGPTIDMPVPGVHCAAIAESRHPDVMEMDAASRTGINDVREIIEGVRYGPVAARYKVYIIDEVHMLSTQAFNGLLKTLEEPPPHVKFIFATTEVRKVPVTVLSRCQRFDLKRIDASGLMALLSRISRQEKVTAEDNAMRLIARAAEGSARDALSILDQAIAQSAGTVEEGAVRDMLGLADRTRTIELLHALLVGDAAKALTMMEEQTGAGADPLSIVQDLAGLVHVATKAKVLGGETDDAAPETERKSVEEITGAVGVAHLARLWQMLLKGIQEVQTSGDAIAAAEMVLIRLAYVADLPSPEELVRRLQGGVKLSARPAAAAERPQSSSPRGAGSGGGASASRAQAAARIEPSAQSDTPVQPSARLDRFGDLVAEAERRKELRFARELKDDVHLIRFEWGLIEFEPAERAAPDLAARIKRALEGWTGTVWMVSLAKGEGAKPPSARSQRQAAEARLRADAAGEPLVKAILAAFPGAKIVDVRESAAAPAPIADVPEPADWDDES